MKLTIFGATGRTGQLLVQQALNAGHSVTALARRPEKLTIQHPRLTIVQGDIQDARAVEQAVNGAEAVLSALGPVGKSAPLIISTGTGHVLDAMKKNGVRRLVVSIGAGIGDPQDRPTLFHRVIPLIIKTFARQVYEDMTEVARLVRASDRDWIIVRAPMLTDAPLSGNLKIGYLGRGVGSRLSRADFAAFMLRQVDDDSYLHQAPVISN
jgi:putative NADH-flavin reductase